MEQQSGDIQNVFVKSRFHLVHKDLRKESLREIAKLLQGLNCWWIKAACYLRPHAHGHLAPSMYWGIKSPMLSRALEVAHANTSEWLYTPCLVKYWWLPMGVYGASPRPWKCHIWREALYVHVWVNADAEVINGYVRVQPFTCTRGWTWHVWLPGQCQEFYSSRNPGTLTPPSNSTKPITKS